MQTHSAQCIATTNDVHHIVDVTDQVEALICDCSIRNGQATVYTTDPACVVMMNERETGLLGDIRETIERLGTIAPQEGRAMIGSTSVVIPVNEGSLYLGQWQRILLVELGGGRQRDVLVQIVGE
jgi:secondary thiamine-phosphate synthase enzyme